MVTDAGDDFIFTCKPASHKALHDFIDVAGATLLVPEVLDNSHDE